MTKKFLAMAKKKLKFNFKTLGICARSTQVEYSNSSALLLLKFMPDSYRPLFAFSPLHPQSDPMKNQVGYLNVVGESRNWDY